MTWEPQRPVFITGSQAYGKPTADSDIDIVVMADENTKNKLVDLLGKTANNYDGDTVEVCSGKIHLIICTKKEQYDAWKKGTDMLREVAPVDKEKATKALNHIRGLMFKK